MKNFKWHERLKLINAGVVYLAIAILIGCLLANYLEFWKVGFWRHDAIYYQPSYLPKLSSEGRWINYLLSPTLRILPAHFAIACIYLSLLYYCYVCAVRVSQTKSFALLLSLIAVQIPFLQTQVQWPATTLPSFLLLALAAFLAKKISPYLIFLIFSVLFFGTLSHLYFLLPILFLRDLDAGKFLRLFITWIVCFILGFAASQLVTYLITGNFIEIAGWRDSNKIETFSDFIVNTERSFNSFLYINSKLFQLVGTVLGSIALISIFIDRTLRKDIFSVVFLGCSALAVYITSIYLGLWVQERTALVYVVCLLFLMFGKREYSENGKFISSTIALLIGVQLAITSHQAIAWYANVTGIIKDEMARTLPEGVDENTKVLLSMSERSVHKIVKKIEFCEDLQHVVGENIDTIYRISTALRELGIQNIYSCSDCDPEPGELILNKQNCSNRVFKYKLLKPNEYVLLPTDTYLR